MYNKCRKGGALVHVIALLVYPLSLNMAFLYFFSLEFVVYFLKAFYKPLKISPELVSRKLVMVHQAERAIEKDGTFSI